MMASRLPLPVRRYRLTRGPRVQSCSQAMERKPSSSTSMRRTRCLRVTSSRAPWVDSPRPTTCASPIVWRRGARSPSGAVGSVVVSLLALCLIHRGGLRRGKGRLGGAGSGEPDRGHERYREHPHAPPSRPSPSSQRRGGWVSAWPSVGRGCVDCHGMVLAVGPLGACSRRLAVLYLDAMESPRLWHPSKERTAGGILASGQPWSGCRTRK
jgi:hypothetical protein